MEQSNQNRFVLISSPLMSGIADSIVKRLEARGFLMSHLHLEFHKFPNGEFVTQIPQAIRGQHVFFLHALQHPDPNTAFMQMLIALDAMQRASVCGVTLVTPYLPYLRQDRKDQPRVPISARMIADLIESNKAVKQLITIDMHAEQEQGFFSIPVENLTGVRLFAEHVRERFADDLANDKLVAVSADFGASVRNNRLAKALGGIPVTIFEKQHPARGETKIVSVIAPRVRGMRVVIYEDIIDSGGTILKVESALMDMGATSVHVYATHGIFSGNALANFAVSKLDVNCTDSIPRSSEFYSEHSKWFTRVPIDAYFAEAIYEATQMGGSISKLSS